MENPGISKSFDRGKLLLISYIRNWQSRASLKLCFYECLLIHAMRNPTDKVFGLELWFSIFAKKTLKCCTKTNLQRNQTNGVLKVGSTHWSDQWCRPINGWLKNMVFFMQFIYRKNKRPLQKMAMLCGNLSDIIFRLKLCSSFCAKKTLQSCTKTNKRRNQTNGVLKVGSTIRCFSCTFYREKTHRRSQKWLCHAEISRTCRFG
jgi:hypothetical protein